MTLSHYLRSVTRRSYLIRVSFTLAGVLTVSVATVSLSQPAQAHSLSCHHRSVQSVHARACSSARAPRRSGVPGRHASSTGASAGIGPWTPVPGHPTFTMQDFAGDPYSHYFGVCTWWAWYQHQSEGMLGKAKDWTAHARALGYGTGTVPAVGATAVFQPGVQGASPSGHVGHVEQVLGGGWFVISEMNFYWNGGGWGKVDYRYVHAGPGVTFVY